MSDKTGDRIAVITVHGTGDVAEGKADDGQKWFQRGSVFTDRLVKRLASHGIVADIIPHHWSGANSAKGREQGAEKLAKLLQDRSKRYAGVHVVGHSHGGNVANDAASMLSWRRRKKPKHKLDSITTVGTPFFKSELSLSESLGGIAFLAISVLSVLTLIVLTVALAVLTYEANISYADTLAQVQQENPTLAPAAAEEMAKLKVTERDEAADGNVETFGLIALSIIPLFFIFPLAFNGLRRILRLRAKKYGDAMLFSLWHPNDEAIAFLQRVENLPLTPFPKGAMWRGSRTSAIVWGVRVILIFAAASLIGLIASYFAPDATVVWGKTDAGLPNHVSLGVFSGWSLVVSLLGAPLIFAISYLLWRLLGGLVPEWFFRHPLNNGIAGIVKGMAFGQDGDERIGKVATMSHAFGCREHIVQGEVAQRMQAAAAESAGKLIERYRWALFTVGPDTNASLDALATDAMTWDSLIHTTYFDQPETADVIGDYIADEAKKAKAGG